MPDSDSFEQGDPRKLHHAYAQLGLDAGATMREIEAAYWRFARELRGQAAMGPYTEAYEALVNGVRPRANNNAPAPAEQQQVESPASQVVYPGSKFAWPAH